MKELAKTEQVFSLLAWLRCRCQRYGVENIESLLSFVQGYCVGSGASYSAFSEMLFDSVKEYFELNHQLLPALAIKKNSPSESCETASFYAWCDWITGDEVEVLAESALSDAEAVCFRNKQHHYHGVDATAIVPTPKYIYICKFKKIDGNFVIFLDEDHCRFYEMYVSSFDSAVKHTNGYIGAELLWVETRRFVSCGVRGSFAEKQR